MLLCLVDFQRVFVESQLLLEARLRLLEAALKQTPLS
jgi:hypothetical protein